MVMHKNNFDLCYSLSYTENILPSELVILADKEY